MSYSTRPSMRALKSYQFDDLREISDRRLLDLKVCVDLEIQKRRDEAARFLSLTEGLPMYKKLESTQVPATNETPGGSTPISMTSANSDPIHN